MKSNQAWLSFSSKKHLRLKQLLQKVAKLDHQILKWKIEKLDSSLRETLLEKLKKKSVKKNSLISMLKLKQKTISLVNLKRWITNFKKNKRIKMRKIRRNLRCLEKLELMQKIKAPTQVQCRLIAARSRTMDCMKLEQIVIEQFNIFHFKI